MSEVRDYLEQHPELDELTPDELEAHLAEASDRSNAEYEAWRDGQI